MQRNAFIAIVIAGIAFTSLIALNALCIVHCLFHTEINPEVDILEIFDSIIILIAMVPIYDLMIEYDRRFYGIGYMFYTLFHRLRYGFLPPFCNGRLLPNGARSKCKTGLSAEFSWNMNIILVIIICNSTRMLN